jgi:hypothetical protein
MTVHPTYLEMAIQIKCHMAEEKEEEEEKDLKPILQSFKCPLNRNSKARVSEIKQFLWSPMIVRGK